jgi:hypothetical protein
MYIVGCYMSYLLISLAVTVWVARTLHKNGRVFLVDAFHGNGTGRFRGPFAGGGVLFD